MLQLPAPQTALAHILAIFDNDIDKRLLMRRNHLTFQADTVCLLYSGDYSLLRRRDELLVTRALAPCIVGLILPGTIGQFITIRANGDCHYQLVSNEDFFNKIADQQAYLDVYTLLLEHITWQYQREELLLGHSSQVCVQGAIHLLDQSEPLIRDNTNVADFVVKSTKLSRSMVMKSMALLRQQKAIEVVKGKLGRINFLPDIH